jgi:hypothetical protein
MSSRGDRETRPLIGWLGRDRAVIGNEELGSVKDEKRPGGDEKLENQESLGGEERS